jgi:hypothetical protein
MARRTHSITVYLSDEEKASLDYICEDNLSYANAVRLMIMAVTDDLLYISSDNAAKFNELYEKYSRK